MRVAAIYDIHGNLPALEPVLEEIDRVEVDRIVVGGDIVPGPMPGEAVAALTDLPVPVDFIHGNGEREMLAGLDGADMKGVPEEFREIMRWVAQALPPEHTALMASWPPTLRLQLSGLGEVLFCHATPRSDSEIFTRITSEARLQPVFEGVDADIVVCGHTHMQFDRQIGDVRVVNAGSVGMPFAEPGAYWLLLGSEVELRHTPYDLAAAAERIRTSGYPQADQFADDYLLKPPSEAEMLEQFERAALR